MHLPLARAHRDITTCPTTGAQTLGLFKEPDSHLKTKIFARQSSHGTDIHRVE